MDLYTKCGPGPASCHSILYPIHGMGHRLTVWVTHVSVWPQCAVPQYCCATCWAWGPMGPARWLMARWKWTNWLNHIIGDWGKLIDAGDPQWGNWFRCSFVFVTCMISEFEFNRCSQEQISTDNRNKANLNKWFKQIISTDDLNSWCQQIIAKNQILTTDLSWWSQQLLPTDELNS